MYLALYRKWRPKTFEDVVGQEHITKTLKNEVLQQQLAHAYLFTGSRGTGKTTCSKILAKAVNCLHPVDGNPCLVCENCRAIEDGTLLDVVEMDAASNNGVNDVRLLREEANYTPAQGKYRVYIIDETHMLSTSAFNALLKTMEEPPPHVIFVLATTEVHKVPATILSRCQRFDFVRIPTEKIAARLQYIAAQEQFTLTADAAHLIARLAEGGMRDAISLMDQCTSYSREVTTEVVSGATGLVLQDYLFELTEALRRQSVPDAISKIDELYEGSKDLQKLLGDLVNHYRNLMIARTVPHPQELISCLPEDLARIQQQAQTIPLSTILYALTVLQEAMAQMGRGHNKRLAAEMAMIKLCTPSLDRSDAAILSRLERLEQQLRSGAAVAPQPAPVQTLPQETTASAPAEPTVRPITTEPVAAPKQADPPKQEEAPKPPAPAEEPQPFTRWPEILAELQERDPALCGVLAGSLAFTYGAFLLIDCPNVMLSPMLKKDTFSKQRLVALLEEKTGVRYTLRIKRPKQAPKVQDKMQDFLSDAKQLGIPMDTETNG